MRQTFCTVQRMPVWVAEVIPVHKHGEQVVRTVTHGGQLGRLGTVAPRGGLWGSRCRTSGPEWKEACQEAEREVKVRLGAEVCRDCFLPKQGAVCRELEPVNEEATTASLFKTVPNFLYKNSHSSFSALRMNGQM